MPDPLPASPSAIGVTGSACRLDGKFLQVGGRRWFVKGVTYGTFAPDEAGDQFPPLDRVRADFARMAASGINTVRVYTPPREALLDAAAEAGLGVMVGVPWTQHVAFLDDMALARAARREVAAHVGRLGLHPAARLFAVGNEIPPGVVRWHGARRIERFLRDLADAAHEACPDALLTYVNFPPTEFLDLDPFDVCAFNVYLHRERDLRAYLTRLQHVAGQKPLLLAEAGADSVREGEAGQAQLTAMHLRAAFEVGCCGAIAYAWTDEWWRGGREVADWKFGLVNAERQPKPALAAVAEAFRDVPFGASARATWPKVSVVVCAYNAADTLEDCLTSLERLTYPDVEIIVVDDGSKDATPGIAARHASVRVISVPNGGLSAARNLGLAHATGEILAYTDADTRVDPDWLTFLVQPMLDGELVGCGGPNVVPADDPDLAQCVARAPGGPTHVLLDDRIAEHVPGCNMAFRRAALQAIGGFNPIYLRAGDDVDVCWRLQAAGGRIGFAPAALVWHHHRASVKAYWRQQVGYGEGEVWLRHQHPDKFSASNMVWHGRIYSALPFVRALTRQRMDTGVWGLASFPSIYHTGAEPWTYLPHSAPWYIATAALLLAGVGALATLAHPGIGWLLMAAGSVGLATTAGRCVRYARASDLRGLVGRHDPNAWRRALRLRAVIAWLHFLQPLARLRGRLRGRLEPPALPAVAATIPPATSRPVPALCDVWTALRVLGGASVEDVAWSQQWLAVDEVLTRVLAALRLARVSPHVEVTDGWEQRHDVTVGLGRWSRFELSMLVEEHAEGRVLVRQRIGLRPSLLAGTVVVLAVLAIVAVSFSPVTQRWPALTAAAVLMAAVGLLARLAYRTASALAGLRGVTRHALAMLGAQRVGDRRARIRPGDGLGVWRYAARIALAGLLASGLVLGSSLIVRDAVVTTERQFDLDLPLPEVHAPRDPAVPHIGLALASNGDLYLSDTRQDTLLRVSTRGEPAVPAAFGDVAIVLRPHEGAPRMGASGGIAIAPRGDLFVADIESHRVYRVDRVRGTTTIVAGAGHAGFGGDGGPATRALLNQPAAVAVDRDGNLYIADSGNHRVRKVNHRTGVITTIAGTGSTGGAPVPASPPAPAGAHAVSGQDGLRVGLSWPTDLAMGPNHDLYIADMGHHRILRLDGRRGTATTVAGTGVAGAAGDGGPATAALLSSPTGVAVVARGRQVTLYIADSSNGRVRVVTPDGTIGTLTLPDATRVGSPFRVAYHPRGYLYVAGAAGRDALTAVQLGRSGAVTASRRTSRPAPLTMPQRRIM